jgi:hypothetical protein
MHSTNAVLQTAQGAMGDFFSVLPTMGMVLAWLVPAGGVLRFVDGWEY